MSPEVIKMVPVTDPPQQLRSTRPETRVTETEEARDRRAAAVAGMKPPVRDSRSVTELEEMVSNLNDFAQTMNRDLQFSVDEDSGRTVIKVIDSETKETIRQIPPEEVVALAAHFRDGEGGLLRERA